MGNAEQVSITNIAFVEGATGVTDQLNVMVTNSGSTPVTISSAFINGVDVTATMNPVAPLTDTTIQKSSSGTITLDAGIDALSPGTAYQVKLITQKGTSVVNTATYNP